MGLYPERVEATEGMSAGSDYCLLNSLKIMLMPYGKGPGEARAAGRDINRRHCSLAEQEKMEGNDRFQRCCVEELGEIRWE